MSTYHDVTTDSSFAEKQVNRSTSRLQNKNRIIYTFEQIVRLLAFCLFCLAKWKCHRCVRWLKPEKLDNAWYGIRLQQNAHYSITPWVLALCFLSSDKDGKVSFGVTTHLNNNKRQWIFNDSESRTAESAHWVVDFSFSGHKEPRFVEDRADTVAIL